MEKRMLWLGLMLMVIGLCSSGALASTMGPPVAGLDAGQFSVGVGYSTSEIGIEGDGKGTLDFEVSGPLINFDITGTEKFKFTDDIESDMILANLGYGISDNWEVALLLGVADFSLGDDSDLEGSDEFAYGFNVKYTFYEEADLKVGALLQMTLGSADASWTESEDIPGTDEEIEVDATFDTDYYELKFAVGPSYKLTEGCSIYGGPFVHLWRGDFEIKAGLEEEIEDHEISFSAKESGDMEEASNFGGYIGAQIDLAENLPLAVEYQFTGDANVLGASLVYRF